MSLIGPLLDLLLAATPPALVAASGILTVARGDDPAATLQGLAVLAVAVPWTTGLPVVIYVWLRRIGLPTPGQLLTGASLRPPSGGPLGDVALIAAAAACSAPLFYAEELLYNEVVAGLLMGMAPTLMAVATLVIRPRDPHHEHPIDDQPAGS